MSDVSETSKPEWRLKLVVFVSGAVLMGLEMTGSRVLKAFLDQGIPVVLLIDFRYPWFHTTGDTPDKCSAESLGQVGRAVMEAVEAP